MKKTVHHDIPPIFDNNSSVLILGTMPSPKSRDVGFYYSHPQNRFWRVMSELFNSPVPINNDEKRLLMLNNRIALWDVLSSCTIKGAADDSIENPVPNDIRSILAVCKINAVFTTGKKATNLYNACCLEKTQKPAIYLPSTSPANRRISTSALIDAYKIILTKL